MSNATIDTPKLGWFSRWRLRREARQCRERASQLYRWGDPEAAQDQMDRANAIRRVIEGDV